MIQVNLTNKEQERLESLLNWRIKVLPNLIQNRKERQSGTFHKFVSFESKDEKEAINDNQNRIYKMESNLILYKTMLKKIKKNK